jgi:hypothetical protein
VLRNQKTNLKWYVSETPPQPSIGFWSKHPRWPPEIFFRSQLRTRLLNRIKNEGFYSLKRTQNSWDMFDGVGIDGFGFWLQIQLGLTYFQTRHTLIILGFEITLVLKFVCCDNTNLCVYWFCRTKFVLSTFEVKYGFYISMRFPIDKIPSFLRWNSLDKTFISPFLAKICMGYLKDFEIGPNDWGSQKFSSPAQKGYAVDVAQIESSTGNDARQANIFFFAQIMFFKV